MILFFNERANVVRWRNTDGTPGGDVSKFARVHPSVIIERYAVVCSGADIGPNQRVPSGAIVTRDGTVVRFGHNGAMSKLTAH